MNVIFIFTIAKFFLMGLSFDKVVCQTKHLFMLTGTFHVNLYQLLFLNLETVSQDEKNKALIITTLNKPITYFLN